MPLSKYLLKNFPETPMEFLPEKPFTLPAMPSISFASSNIVLFSVPLVSMAAAKFPRPFVFSSSYLNPPGNVVYTLTVGLE